MALHKYNPIDRLRLGDVIPVDVAASPNEKDDAHDDSEDGNDPASGLQATTTPAARGNAADHDTLLVVSDKQ